MGRTTDRVSLEKCLYTEDGCNNDTTVLRYQGFGTACVKLCHFIYLTHNLGSTMTTLPKRNRLFSGILTVGYVLGLILVKE